MTMQADLNSPLRPVSAVLDAVSCGAVLMDRVGTIVHVNRRLSEMVARPQPELIGRNVREFYRAEGARRQIDLVLQRFNQPGEYEFHVPRPDGSQVPVLVFVPGEPPSGPAPLHDYRVVTVVDLSTRKRSEEQYRVQYDNLAHLSDTVIEQAIALKHYSEKLEERVRERTAELHEANMDAIYMLAVASEAKDEDTGAHVRRIQHYSTAIARRMGLRASEADEIGYSAILHDVGKIHVPDRILQKPGALTDGEREIMKHHTLVGERILSTERFFDVARQITRTHHENWDGSGYPDGLAGDAIPLCARIVRIADVFDALTNERVYKPAWTVERAAQHIRSGAGQLFDTDVANTFLDLLADGKLDLR